MRKPNTNRKAALTRKEDSVTNRQFSSHSRPDQNHLNITHFVGSRKFPPLPLIRFFNRATPGVYCLNALGRNNQKRTGWNTFPQMFYQPQILLSECRVNNDQIISNSFDTPVFYLVNSLLPISGLYRNNTRIKLLKIIESVSLVLQCRSNRNPYCQFSVNHDRLK